MTKAFSEKPETLQTIMLNLSKFYDKKFKTLEKINVKSERVF